MIHVVERGTVTREVVFDGEVSAAATVAIVAPFAGVIDGPLPDPGTLVSAGDVLFEIAPSLEVRLAATELEAALLAREAGRGDSRELEERVSRARQAAIALGLPVDERAGQPLSELVSVLAPQDGTVVRVFPPDGGEVAGGQRIVEIGDAGILTVRADLNEEVAGLIRIGQAVALDGGGSGRPVPAVVNRVGVDEQGRPVLNAVFGPGDIEAGAFSAGTAVVLSQNDRPDTAGRVLSVEVLASSLVAVRVVVEGETLSFDEGIRIAPRDGGESIVGQVTEVAVDEDAEPFLLIDVTGSDLVLGEQVSVSFAVSERHDVLWLAPAAIRSFAGRSFVIVATEAGEQSRVDVDVGLVTADRVEVSGDLDEGEMVIEP